MMRQKKKIQSAYAGLPDQWLAGFGKVQTFFFLMESRTVRVGVTCVQVQWTQGRTGWLAEKGEHEMKGTPQGRKEKKKALFL